MSGEGARVLLLKVCLLCVVVNKKKGVKAREKVLTLKNERMK